MEEFKMLEENKNFIIYKDGRLQNIKTKNFYTPSVDKDGYLRYTLTINGKTTTRFVHRLIAQYFIPNPENKTQVNHIDENKINNKIENLEWVTPQENANWGTRNNRIKRMGQENYNHRQVAMCDKQTHQEIQIFNSIAEALDFLGKNRTNTYAISKVCKNPQYSAYGYWWKYI